MLSKLQSLLTPGRTEQHRFRRLLLPKHCSTRVKAGPSRQYINMVWVSDMTLVSDTFWCPWIYYRKSAQATSHYIGGASQRVGHSNGACGGCCGVSPAGAVGQAPSHPAATREATTSKGKVCTGRWCMGNVRTMCRAQSFLRAQGATWPALPLCVGIPGSNGPTHI